MDRVIRIWLLLMTVSLMQIMLPGATPCQCPQIVDQLTAKALIDGNPALIVVDVRYSSEFCGELEHIPGAVNHPWIGEIVQGYEELPTDVPILVICKTGSRSLPAANFLCANGFSTIYSAYPWGMSTWQYETELWPCCTTAAECNDGNICTDDSCSINGFCRNIDNTDPCDDGLYCTETDQCSGGVCAGSGTPCGSCELCDDDLDQCIVCTDDCDCDGVLDLEPDNCVAVANGPDLGTCARLMSGLMVGTGVLCTDDQDCATGQTCQKNQEDANGNGAGDVCDCYADCDCNRKVDLQDLVMLKTQFMQSCPPSPCTADVNGDNKVDLSDLVVMKNEFLRTGCPPCL